MMDTLVVHDTILKVLDAIQLVNGVSNFYQVAWSNLLWFIGIFGAAIAICIPILFALIQRQTNKQLERSLREKTERDMQVIQESVTKKLAEVDSQLSKHNLNILEMECKILRNTAYTLRDLKNRSGAYENMVLAGMRALSIENYKILNEVVKSLCNEIIPYMDEVDAGLVKDRGDFLPQLITEMQNDSREDDRYGLYIQRLKEALNSSKYLR
ncbi:MAG TPA: hypothetical protein VLX68_01145 [Chitinivibrionales bacterium]|nr:hypothetical protein [Chitinivibrionales bacterium]